MSRVVILGAGIAGLTTAYRRTSSDTVLLEGTDRIAGSIRTIHDGAFTLEMGPNTLRTNAAAERLLSDLGLGADTVVADPMAPRYIVREGRPRTIVPGPPGLFTDALTLGGKLRILGEPFVSRRNDDLDDESVHSFFERRFGPELARYAAGPIVSGVYADDPRTLSVRSAFPALWEAEGRSGSVVLGLLRRPRQKPRPPRARTVNFRRGLVQLAEALSLKLSEKGVRIETGSAAAALEGPLSSGSPWRVVTGDGRTFEAETVVSTLDAPSLARLLGDRLPRSGRALGAMSASPLAVVVTAFRDTPAREAPKGFGVLIPRGEGYRALGVLYPSSLFAGRTPDGHLVTTAFLGGALDPDLASAPDEDLIRLAEEESRRLHPRLGPKVGHWIHKWPAAIPRLPLGHHRTVGDLAVDLAELNVAAGEKPSLLVTGSFKDGVALAERVARGEEIGALLSAP